MKILLTGFQPFGSLKINPSQVIIEKIRLRQKFNNVHDINIKILEVNFGAAGAEIKNLIQELKPELVLGLGVSAGSDSITLERIATNKIDDVNLHNSIDIKSILPRSPICYESTLPLKGLYTFLKNRNIPVFISDDAGKFVCNYVFYVALREIDLLGNKANVGFIHVPLMSEQVQRDPIDIPSLPISLMVYAIESCIEFAALVSNCTR